MYKERIDQYIDEHKEEMIRDLKMLVKIDSQKGETRPGMPFGEGPAKAMAAAEELMKGYGLKTRNYENYVVTGDFNGKEKQLDILAHLDVVPASEDWAVTQPFEPLVKDGKIYGRGTADDKGPAVAALYALRAIKELQIPLKKNVRLILGTDEECGSSDLKYYYEKEQEAPMSFTPDADFPVINIEKGRLAKQFKASFEMCKTFPRILQMEGGSKANVVPQSAFAVVEGMELPVLQEAAAKAEAEWKASFTILPEETGARVRVRGSAAHASTPEMGNNAVTALLQMLKQLPLAKSDGHDKVIALAELFPHNDFGGKGLDIAMEDDISGELTINLGILEYSPERLQGEIDSRTPICADDKNVTEVIRVKMKDKGIYLEEGNMIPPHHVPEETVFVRTLLESYERYMGIRGKAMAIGGGTYVHELKRGVAFGCMVPEVDNHMHGDDEFMELEMLFTSSKIFADAIIKLCNMYDTRVKRSCVSCLHEKA